MKIGVISVDEETGRVELELDDEALTMLVNIGINKILSDALENE